MSVPLPADPAAGRIGRAVGALRGRIFYGWWIVLVGSAINAVGGGVFFHGFTVFFLPLKAEFQTSSAAISVLYAAARLEGGLEGPLVGHLISRFGPRAVIVTGVTMAGGGLLLLTQVPNYWTFFFVYVCIVSLGYNAGFFHPVSTMVNSWFIRRRGVALSCVSASANAGGMIMAPLLATIIQVFGWRWGAAAAGFVLLGIGLPAAIPIRRSPESVGLRPDGEPSARTSHPEGDGSPPGDEPDFSVREALRTRVYWALMGAISLRLFVTTALTTHFVPILVWGGMGEAAAAYLVGLSAFGSILATVAMGWIADHWRKPLLCSLGLVPMIVCMAGLTLGHPTVLLYGFAVALALTMGTAPINWALIGDFFGRRSYATLRGLMAVCYGTMTFLSPIYGGWVHDATGSYALVLLTFAGVLLTTASLFAVLRVPPTPRRLAGS